MSPRYDLAIVGAGAVGLAAAVYTRELAPTQSVVLLDGAKKPGAKILVSGGGRCNVTNVTVSERDFWGGPSFPVRQVLRAFSVPDTVAFFARIGVPLRQEEDGKLFPVSNRARDVLDALLSAATSAGAELRLDHRVADVALGHAGFRLSTSQDIVEATRVVLAAGGRSVPKSGSDGTGYAIAARLGHTIVPPTPALVPLLLADGERALYGRLAGVAHEVELAVWIDGRIAIKLAGALLWTHVGISGPVALNTARHWERASLEKRTVSVGLSFCPGLSFEAIDRRLLHLAADRPRASAATLLSDLVPASVATVLADETGIYRHTTAAQLSREDRRRIAHMLGDLRLDVVGTRGYNHAEVTAGGVALNQINPRTLESRICPGLYFVGEILDVDGRIGGFNFQWAWSSAFVAARALAARA